MKKNIVIGILIFCVIGVILMHPSASMASQIDKDSKFHHSTSITGNYSSEKAKVYTIDMTVPETAQYIISKQRPEDYTDLNNEESIQLFYDDYCILIYKGEEEKTYVQVSSRKYIHNNGYYGMYRPYNPSIIIFYDNYYRRRYFNIDTQRYGSGGYYKSTSTNSKKPVSSSTSSSSSNKIKTGNNNSSKIKTGNTSVRNGSTSSRSSMGGGISFGK